MLTIRIANERDHITKDWLDTYHSFSFGKYGEFSFLFVRKNKKVCFDGPLIDERNLRCLRVAL